MSSDLFRTIRKTKRIIYTTEHNYTKRLQYENGIYSHRREADKRYGVKGYTEKKVIVWGDM